MRKAAVLSKDSSCRRSTKVLTPGDSLPLLSNFLLASFFFSRSSGHIASHSSEGGRKPGSGMISRGFASEITWIPTASKCASWTSPGLLMVCRNLAKGIFSCGEEKCFAFGCGSHLGNWAGVGLPSERDRCCEAAVFTRVRIIDSIIDRYKEEERETPFKGAESAMMTLQRQVWYSSVDVCILGLIFTHCASPEGAKLSTNKEESFEACDLDNTRDMAYLDAQRLQTWW